MKKMSMGKEKPESKAKEMKEMGVKKGMGGVVVVVGSPAAKGKVGKKC